MIWILCWFIAGILLAVVTGKLIKFGNGAPPLPKLDLNQYPIIVLSVKELREMELRQAYVGRRMADCSIESILRNIEGRTAG